MQKFTHRVRSRHIELIDNAAYPPDMAVTAALADDLNTASAIARLHELSKSGDFESLQRLWGSLLLLGLMTVNSQFDILAGEGVGWIGNYPKEVEDMINKALQGRQNAKRIRDFAKADLIRDALISAGVDVRDSADGPNWSIPRAFDPAKLEALK